MPSQFEERFTNLLYSRLMRPFGVDGELIYRAGPAEKPAAQVKGIFTHSSTVLGDGMSVADFVSTFEILAGDYSSPTKGDSVRVSGEIFKIAETQRDSAGVLKLILKKEKRLKNVKKD